MIDFILDSYLCYFQVYQFCVLFILGYLTYYFCYLARRPILICGSEEYRRFLQTRIPALRYKFWPIVWCTEPILNSLFACISQISKLSYHREIFTLKDGGEVALDWMHPAHDVATVPVIIILPGLTSCSTNMYIQEYVIAGHRAGFRIIVFNNRGTGGILLKTPLTYCATHTANDLFEVASHVRNKYPDCVIGCLGISLGGLILGNYLLKETKESRLISAALLVSTPFDVCKATKNTEGLRWNRFINIYLTRSLINYAKDVNQHLTINGEHWVASEVFKSKTVREFDQAFTCKIFGYNSVEEYYREASLHENIGNVQIPVLCLNAADDPLQPFDGCFSDSGIKLANSVAILITKTGGHIGFCEGLWPFNKQYRFCHRVFVQFFSSMFNNDSYKEFVHSTS